jgi:hypothetical protein
MAALRDLVAEYCAEAHEWCQTCCDGSDAADAARAQATLSVRAALVGNYAAALANAREAERIEQAASDATPTWGNLPECCELLLEIVAEQRVAVFAKGLASADRDVMTGLECIGLYNRHAQEAICDLSRAVDQEGAEAAIKSALGHVEGMRDYFATMGRDMELLREAWLAHLRARAE